MKTIEGLKLYHGTNTVFIDYMEKYGLGGYDIVKASEAVELLSKLDKISEHRTKEKYMEADWGTLRMSVAGILLQTPGDFINWQHGDVYLTPSLNRALRYAVSNSLGSEIFTYIYKVYTFLTKLEINEAEEIVNDYPIATEIISKKVIQL